ncbi:thiamine pyrophosphate-dependent enzyme [Siccirubricoccus sp. KC 17139]|uniref:Thiamine pyrophosphate-dependent enzyme n=1 Tax=Siccirubricoccus soli TaxID=2899147 RepID=A0ABT1D3A1_9PROT|nr:thiamine pyrophosphate-dependent enzyme [Siccirubricoccus soli]MCO6415470.1 thiamine pyrophosphate-dependent enzyme [Siccirubricoccus soli]MCP2681602.1 thiamine pyrophosphate-dependent enzyme [Siccirubricoccus soli]
MSVTTAHNAKRMYRFDLTKRLVAKLHRDEAVIGGIGHSNFDLFTAGHRPQNFYMLGSMGLAIPIALGVAIAQPQRKVFAIEGDGSLLMQLGCLSTVATQAPKNLVILVMDNGTYQITGGQATPAAGGTDYVAIARGCGIQSAAWAADEADFERLVEHCLAADGPHLIGLKLDEQGPAGQTERDPSQIRDRFMRGMGAKKSKLTT